MFRQMFFVLTVLAAAPFYSTAQAQHAGPYPPVPQGYYPYKASTVAGDLYWAWAAIMRADSERNYMNSLALEHLERARAAADDNAARQREFRTAKFAPQRKHESAQRAKGKQRRLGEAAKRDQEAMKLVLALQAEGGVPWPAALRAKRLGYQTKTVDYLLRKLVSDRMQLGLGDRERIVSNVKLMREAMNQERGNKAATIEACRLLYNIERLVNISRSAPIATTKSAG